MTSSPDLATSVRPTAWVLPVPLAARAAGELVIAMAEPLPPPSRRTAAKLTALLVNRVRELAPVAVWLRIDVGPDQVHVEVADAAAVRPCPTYTCTERRLPPQNAVGLPPLVEQHAHASGVRQLDEAHRSWWFEIDVPQGG